MRIYEFIRMSRMATNIIEIFVFICIIRIIRVLAFTPFSLQFGQDR
jgi:hypothetical protein